MLFVMPIKNKRNEKGVKQFKPSKSSSKKSTYIEITEKQFQIVKI